MTSMLCTYASKEENWLAKNPRNAAEKSLLLVNGSVAEIAFYERAGWAPFAVVFSPGLAGKIPLGKGVFVSPHQGEWPLSARSFDAVICNQSLGLVSDIAALLRQFARHLRPSGRVYIRLPNPRFYANALARMDGVARPWPHNYPQGALLEPAQLRALLPADLEILEQREKVDGLYHDPRCHQWSHVDGFLHRFLLPRDPSARKACFVELYDVELQLHRRSDRPLGESDSVHAQIEQLLEHTMLDEAALLIDNLFSRGNVDAATYNLQGILHFYRGQHSKAWDSFRLAIEMNPGMVDMYQNLRDVAALLGRERQAREIIQRDQLRFPALGELL